jgi:hypothetical protein
MSANVYVEIVEKVGDPSIETKEDLAEKATACLMDLGSASKYVVKNSHFHDVRIITAYNLFVHTLFFLGISVCRFTFPTFLTYLERVEYGKDYQRFCCT